MSSKGDPDSSDKADSLSVGSSMSNSTVYAGAGADIGIDSHMIAGELFAGGGADTVKVGGSLVDPSICLMVLLCVSS